MQNSRLHFLAALIATTVCTSSAFADGPPSNPTDIGNFDKRQFVTDSQALTLGKDIGNIVGDVAFANHDGTLTITTCRQVVGTPGTATVADLSSPIFSAIIDGNWGLKVTLAFLNINTTGNIKTTLTATDIADAALPLANIPNTITTPIAGCAFPANAQLYYVQKATLSLINKTTYIETDNTGGLLSFLTISGATYKEQDETNRYTVSVFATPIYPSAQNVATVAKTQAQLMSLATKNVKALGVDKAIGKTRAVVDTKYTTQLKPAVLSPALLNQLQKSSGQ